MLSASPEIWNATEIIAVSDGMRMGASVSRKRSTSLLSGSDVLATASLAAAEAFDQAPTAQPPGRGGEFIAGQPRHAP